MADRSCLGRQLRPPTLHWGKLLRPSVTTIKCYHTGPQILRLHQANGHVSTLSHSLPKHRLGVAENTMVRSRANPLAQAPAPCLGLVSHLFQRKARDSSVRQLPPPEAGEDGAPCQWDTLLVLLRILEFLQFSSVFEPFVDEPPSQDGISSAAERDVGSGSVAPLGRVRVCR